MDALNFSVKSALVFCCSETNGLYNAVSRSGIKAKRYSTLDEALQHAPDHAGLFVLSDRYPVTEWRISREQLDAGKAKGLKWYVEYPEAVAGMEIGRPQAAHWERAVAVSGFFAPHVEPMAILAMHGAWYLPLAIPENRAGTMHIGLARVAGYDRAVYGLPESTAPILYEWPEQNMLIAASSLSNCIRGRYAPHQAWLNVWKRLFAWAGSPEAAAALDWEPSVRTQWGKDDSLPHDAEEQARRRSIRWFREQALYSIDSKKGVLEGFESHIRYDGKQLVRAWLRADCVAEAAMAFAYDYAVSGNPESRQLAAQMLDTVWMEKDFFNGDPGSSDYGLVNWHDRRQVFYGDDNARVILASLAARQILQDSRWDERILACIMGNFRTAGQEGFRRPFLVTPTSFADGRDWKFYRQESFIHLAPHYQCYLWACYLWAYAMTGYEPLLSQAKKAIRIPMEAGPERWKWTNGLTQEIARMVLPLSLLVQLEDTEEHRAWLAQMTDVLLARMEPCGSLRDMLGPLENGKYPPPRSNEDYGVTEASLMQEEGDPVSDLVYTVNWALIGLHEAFAAVCDSRLKEAEDRLAAFLCRIQLRSDAHPELDGAWMRSFDDEKWEYWGSSADSGWGAWCVESGWTNTWIASVLSMRSLGARLYNLEFAESFRSAMPRVLQEMGLKES